MITILITCPRHDKATNYLFYWTQPVIDVIKKRNNRLIDLSEEKANKNLVTQYLRKFKPSLFFFLNGYGSDSSIFSHENRSFLIPISLIKGNNLGEAYRKSQVAMRMDFNRMLSSNASFEEKYYAQFLWSNIKSQTLLGDPDESL